MSHINDDGAKRMPSPRQIRRDMLEIQATWDEKTRHKREVFHDEPEPWTVPEVADTNTAQHGVHIKQNQNVDART